MFQNFKEMIDRVQNFTAKKRVALVAANDEHALEAVFSAADIVFPVLIGDKAKITALLAQLGKSGAQYDIMGTAEGQNPARVAVEMVGKGEADFLMKGKLETATLLKEVVDKDSPLRTGFLMSHVAFFEIPSYHKLLVLTDSGMVTQPDLVQKRQIVANAVDILRRLNYERPKVAVLAAIEQVNPKMRATIDAAELRKLNLSGELSGCEIEGPISYDLAMSMESANIKGFACNHCGNFDVLLVPDMTAGNMLGKCLLYSAGAKMAGIIVGAKKPIVLTSRAASAEEKYLSLVLSAAVS